MIAILPSAFFSEFQNASLPPNLAPDTLAKEVKEATKILGIKSENLILFDFDVRRFKEFRQDILEEMIKIKSKVDPDLVFVPSPTDIHQDHQAIHAEGIRAFRNANLLGYELPWNNFRFQPNYFEKISEENLQAKIKALSNYRSQADRKYMNENFITSLATVRGMQANTDFAEAFEVYRLTK